MPDTVKRLGQWRISILSAMVIMGLVLALLQLVIGYGNAYQSCQRTASTRANGNDRVELASKFWRDQVAATRQRSGDRAAETAAALSLMPTRDPSLKRAFVAYLHQQAKGDRAAAVKYRAYAAGQEALRAQVPDCAQFPPPAS